MTNPRFSTGQEVYIKSSAAIGMLEAVFISGLYQHSAGWMYTFAVGRRPPISPNIYGNQQSLVTGQLLYLSEDELILKCEAYALAEAQATAVLTKIQLLRQTHCQPITPHAANSFLATAPAPTPSPPIIPTGH